MASRDMTISDIERLRAQADAADVAFDMDEASFRAFYERTARTVWAYLARITGDPQAAEDLLQETYYRFLRANAAWDSEAHRRAYLFRIATNLARDRHRRSKASPTVQLGNHDIACDTDPAAADRRADLDRAMRRLKPRERTLLWLAYGVGQPHTEIAGTLGLKTGSVKPLLFRARRKLAELLRGVQPTSSRGADRDLR